jgi:hypothetical protein
MTNPTSKADPEFLAHMLPLLRARQKQFFEASPEYKKIAAAIWRIRYNIKKRGTT